MLAILTLEHEPLSYKDVGPGLHTWLWVVGSTAAVGILLWIIVWSFTSRRRSEESGWSIPQWVFAALIAIGGLAYAGYFIVEAPVYFRGLSSVLSGPSTEKPATPLAGEAVRSWLLNVGSGAALAAVCLWPVLDLFGLRWRLRRIWAIAQLSLKEAIRRKILWAFLVVLLFFLFGMWFLPSKPEDQIRTYVQAVFFIIALLLFPISGLNASLSIPADIRNQTIHTILTKPVERFELVLGRFLGFALLMSGVLFALTLFSLLYLVQEIHPEAVRESLKARVPIYGDLAFYDNDVRKEKGSIVAKEWTYRSYISSERGGRSQQFAAWAFQDVPTKLAGRDSVTCEYSFDVYRTSKGAGVGCSFYCRPWHWEEGPLVFQQEREQSYRAERAQERTADPDFNSFLDSWLILRYGYYTVPAQEITESHTFAITLPVALFEDPIQRLPELQKEAANCPASYRLLAAPLLDAAQKDPTSKQQTLAKLREAEAAMSLDDRKLAFLYRQMPALAQHVENLKKDQQTYAAKPRLEVRVACDSPGQYIGMARYDLYLLDDEQPFWVNFFRGAGGLWFLLMLVIGINVTLSTYLSSIIGWLCSIVWFGLALTREHIVSLAQGSSVGGGPMEALYRLVQRETVTGVPQQTAVFGAATRSDEVTRYFFKVLLYFVPNPEHYWYTDYVAEGFNVPLALMGISGLEMLKWGIPFALLAYYMMKGREVASAL